MKISPEPTKAIKICCEEFEEEYTEGQREGIGLYYWHPQDTDDLVENPTNICIWLETVPSIHDIKFCPLCGKKFELYEK